MYHIKKDKRSQTSAEIICSAMLRLMETHEFRKITVTELQNESEMSRATFYRLFDKMEDVLGYLYHKTVENVFTSYYDMPEDERPPQLLYLIRRIMDNWHIFKYMIQAGQTSIMFEIHEKDLPELMGISVGEGGLDTMTYDYTAYGVTGIIIGALSAWLKRDRKETAEEIYNIIERQLSTALLLL